MDYRDRYSGNFTFRVIDEEWRLYEAPIPPDTIFYNGIIRKFVENDIDVKGYIGETRRDSLREKITIFCLPNQQISSAINNQGQLSKKFFGNYLLRGNFSGNDTIRFQLSYSSGKGYGSSLHVEGIRNLK